MHERKKKSKLAVLLCADPCCPQVTPNRLHVYPELRPETYWPYIKKLNDACSAYENDNNPSFGRILVVRLAEESETMRSDPRKQRATIASRGLAKQFFDGEMLLMERTRKLLPNI